MARPTTITSEQILEAARVIFLEKGISATTAEVARRAGIAEGSIFKRFKTKEHLFFAAMSPGGDPPWLQMILQRTSAEAAHPPQEVKKFLAELGAEMIDFFRKLLPMMMMAWSNAGAAGVPELLRGPDPPPVRATRSLAAMFEAEARAGRLARGDAEVLARLFLGGMQNYAFFEILSRAEATSVLPPEREYLKRVVDVLWRGVDPASAKPRAKRARVKVQARPRRARGARAR